MTFFIGRKTCPYCRKFAAKLATVVAETKAHIYFINSEEPSQLDALQAFRSTYGIPTVPGFLHVEAGEVTVRCDSSMSEEEIQSIRSFIKKIARDQSLAIFHFPKKSSKSFAGV